MQQNDRTLADGQVLWNKNLWSPSYLMVTAGLAGFAL